MKRVKLAVVRSIITEELYEVVMDDKDADEIAKTTDKDALADLVEDALQRAKRIGDFATYKETGVNDKVTFVKIKITKVRE
jgi:hypothetical protein